MNKITITKKKDTKPETTYSVGQWFYDETSDGLCLLAQTDTGVCSLIAVMEKDANRYRRGVPVERCYHITQTELDAMASGQKIIPVDVKIEATVSYDISNATL